MSLRPIGGIFLRLDSSGNLVIYDASGNVDAKILGGAFSLSGNKGTVVSNTPTSSTANTTPTAMGISIQITPLVSSSIFVYFALVQCTNNTAGDGISLDIERKAATENLAGGSSPTGYTLVTGALAIFAATGTSVTLNAQTIDTGLTPGTAYTYAVCTHAVTGGTASWTIAGASLRMGAFEI